MMENNLNKVPPPIYQQGVGEYGNAGATTAEATAGQTYYQPPPPPEGGFSEPPPVPAAPNTVGQRFTQFYAPPNNRKLGLMRRCCSIICCCIVIGLVVGLAAGLTTRNRYRYSTMGSSCNCRVNADCTRRYGFNTFCYNGCQCARRG
ncbi:hypothetical protein BDF20DRAFT_98049 [Mycotypha africana]|uniref:uncharacterized protein n=1 Tax=Mycotypha africana TaxID=64632 RepID=UPI00230152EE|nr:uncharacterized protein BDF20DRAFT_98049 [Mycotypha africana]KAI8969998.1 hypothetical protein BDF20DRAFT_98049 [Mycotypha africana]